MTTHNTKPTHPSLTTPGNFLIAEDPQQALINTLQITSLITYITESDLEKIGDDALWDLQKILADINQALSYEVKRMIPAE